MFLTKGKGRRSPTSDGKDSKMESIKNIVTVGQKVIAHKGDCIGIIINESSKELEVTKVNKKSFIAGGIKFTLWKVTDRDSIGNVRTDGKQSAIFNSQLDGKVTIEF
jgi:hypothetical protein